MAAVTQSVLPQRRGNSHRPITTSRTRVFRHDILKFLELQKKKKKLLKNVELVPGDF